MPVERMPMSLSQFAELLGIDAARFRGVEYDRRNTGLALVMEPDMAQTSGTFPHLTTGGKKIHSKPAKKGAR